MDQNTTYKQQSIAFLASSCAWFCLLAELIAHPSLELILHDPLVQVRYIQYESDGIRRCAYMHHAQRQGCHKLKTDSASNAIVMCCVYINSLTKSAHYISFVVLAHGRPGLVHEK